MRKTFSLALMLTMVGVLTLGAYVQKASSSKEPIEEVETKMIRVGDIDIAYKVFGEGYPLVLMMGY